MRRVLLSVVLFVLTSIGWLYLMFLYLFLDFKVYNDLVINAIMLLGFGLISFFVFVFQQYAINLFRKSINKKENDHVPLVEEYVVSFKNKMRFRDFIYFALDEYKSRVLGKFLFFHVVINMLSVFKGVYMGEFGVRFYFNSVLLVGIPILFFMFLYAFYKVEIFKTKGFEVIINNYEIVVENDETSVKTKWIDVKKVKEYKSHFQVLFGKNKVYVSKYQLSNEDLYKFRKIIHAQFETSLDLLH